MLQRIGRLCRIKNDLSAICKQKKRHEIGSAKDNTNEIIKTGEKIRQLTIEIIRQLT